MLLRRRLRVLRIRVLSLLHLIIIMNTLRPLTLIRRLRGLRMRLRIRRMRCMTPA